MQVSSIASQWKSRALECVGAAAQLVNVAAPHVEQFIVNHVTRGFFNRTLTDADLLVLQSDDTRRGAAMVDQVVKRPQFATVDYDALRTSRPLLKRTSVNVASASDVHRLDVDVSAPGANWAASTNRAGHVALYVDGKYHSDLLVLAERDVPYQINLAGLGAGRHSLELRWSRDLDPTSAKPQIHSVATQQLTGNAALIARYAPVIETRASRIGDGPLAQPALTTDVPMLMAAVQEPLPNGQQRITYEELISNEDGGVSAPNEYRQLGRTSDREIVYRVTLDANGNRVSDMFQGPLHMPYSYKGERVGDRPIMTIATRNNLFTNRAQRTAPLISDLPVSVTPSRLADNQLLVDHPWTTAVMGKEILHEGKVQPNAQHPVYDARRYVYVGKDDPVRQALRSAGLIHLRLTDGSVIPFSPDALKHSIPFPFAPPMGTAIPLPAQITSDAVAGITELAGQSSRTTYVLDDAYHARVLGA